MSDFTGRKLVISLANVVFITGAAAQAVSPRPRSTSTDLDLQVAGSVSVMIAGRFVVGLGVGLASCIVPLYIGELSPTKMRGTLVTFNAVAVTLGQVLAYGALFKYAVVDPSSWGRIPRYT